MMEVIVALFAPVLVLLIVAIVWESMLSVAISVLRFVRSILQ
jgi:hypothetical protein